MCSCKHGPKSICPYSLLRAEVVETIKSFLLNWFCKNIKKWTEQVEKHRTSMKFIESLESIEKKSMNSIKNYRTL